MATNSRQKGFLRDVYRGHVLRLMSFRSPNGGVLVHQSNEWGVLIHGRTLSCLVRDGLLVKADCGHLVLTEEGKKMAEASASRVHWADGTSAGPAFVPHRCKPWEEGLPA